LHLKYGRCNFMAREVGFCRQAAAVRPRIVV